MSANPLIKAVHVLHILNSASGGSNVSTLEMIGALSLRGIKSSIICFNNATPDQARSIQEAVDGRVLFMPLYWMNKRIRAAWWKRPLIELKALWDTHRGFRYQAKIRKFIDEHGITLIHTSTIVNPEGAIAAGKNKLPHVWHVRELIGEDKHFKFYNPKSWAAWVSANCDVLIANSVITAQCLSEFFEKDKISIIQNGIEVSNFKVKTHVNKKQVIIGMVGSVISRWKNHAFFIRVASELKDQDIEFRIYGVVPLSEDVYYIGLKKLVSELGLEDTFKFVDAKPPEVIMQEIDILFHPTNLESFGRIFIEAMAGGIPVIAVNDGGALEMVRDQDNGFLISLDNVKEGIKAIEKLKQNHELRNAMGSKGRALVEERYSLDVLSERMIALYKKVSER